MIWLIAAVAFGVGQSTTKADEIAVSFVHPEGRIDIPVIGLDRVQAYPTFKFRNSETGEVREFLIPRSKCVSPRSLRNAFAN